MPAFLLPDLGEGLTEAEIVTWHVQTGDTVTVDQPIVEVETAKAMVEVPVPFAGRVTALHGQPGDVVAVGAPLVTVDTAGRLAAPGVVVVRARQAAGSAEGTRIPIRGLRKSVADKLSRSRREIPEATVWVDVDATELLGLRAALNADEPAPKISILALLSRFTVLALRRYPELKARIEGDELVLSPPVHLGFAADRK